jgi:hypothetical protein
MANASTFARDVFAWQKQIHTDQATIPNAKPISALDFRLAYAIIQYTNKNSRKAWPFQETLAADLGVTDRTVRNGIANLVKRGHLTVTLRGRDDSAIYEMIIQDRKCASGHDEPRPETDFRSKPQDRKSGAARPEKSRPKTGSTFPIEPLREPLREPLIKSLTVINQSKLIQSDFETWYLQYPKKVEKPSALKAYQRVIKNREATPAELLAAAVRYSAERADQEAKFTKYPATWLNKGCWNDEPSPPSHSKSRGLRADSAIAGIRNYLEDPTS